MSEPEPARAASIPAEAVWVPDRKEFRVSRLVDDLPEGEVRWYRPDGTLACVSTYAAGKGNGPYERLHQTGEWSQRGQQRDGKLDGLCRWRRATGPTTESTLPPVVPENVREARVLYQDGLPGPSRYYDADGVELRQSGQPLPPRPAAVDDRAGFSEDGEVWFFGLGAQDPKTRRGTWSWWSAGGIPIQTQEYQAGGKCIAELVNHPDGSPKLRSYQDARGWRLVQRCFSPGGAEVDTSGDPIPPRPAGLPADAVFDSMNTRWVGGFDPTTLPPMGELTLYALDGTRHETLTFAGGHLRRVKLYNRDGRVWHETTHDELGQEIRDVVTYDDGSPRYLIERTYAGTDLTAVAITVGERTMRGRKAEGGMAYEFHRGGALEARGLVADKKKASGVWEFVHADQTHQVDLTGLGLRADVDEDFEPSPLLGIALLDREQFPEVDAFAGMEPVEWADTPSCYGKNTKHFAHYLRALVADVPAVRRPALSRNAPETQHQGTIYVATARVIPFLLRLLDHPRASVGALLDYLEAVTSQAHAYREQALEWDEDSDDRVAVLGTLAALEQGFAHLAPLVDAPDPDLVAAALALAARAGTQGTALLQKAATHDRWLTAATAVHGLLGQDDLTAETAGPWLEHPDPIVRFCAAIATARRLGPASPARTSVVLGAAIDQETELAPRFAQLPFVKGRLLAYAALNLGNVRDEAAMARAMELAGRLNDLDLFTLDSVTAGLLNLCFGDGTPPYAPGFVDVLAALASCGRLEGFANFSQTSARFGLPGQLAGYRALVEVLRGATDPTAHMATVFEREKEAAQEEEDE